MSRTIRAGGRRDGAKGGGPGQRYSHYFRRHWGGKAMLTRDGEQTRRSFDCHRGSQRSRNKVRRAADRAAICAGLEDMEMT